MRTSGLSCSAARRLFFEADVVAVKDPLHRTGADRDPALSQLAADFLQRQIRLGGHQRQHSLCASSGDRLPPIGLAATNPLRRQRAELGLTSKTAAAS
jgi:hypothetical protein